MFDLKLFFTPSYLFDTSPNPNFKFTLTLVIIFLILIFVGVLAWIFSLKKDIVLKKLLDRVRNLFFTTAALGFSYIFFRTQGAQLISARFVLIIIALIFAVWTGFIIKYIVYNFRDEQVKYLERQRKSKYIPKPKKKRK